MLINNITRSNDYDKALKLRCLYFGAMTLIGLIGFVCYFLLVPGSSLSDHAQGFYLGAATGLTAGGLILLIRTLYVMQHPAAKRKARIEETDERQQLILNKAAVFAGMFTFFGAAGATFVVLPFSEEAYFALLGVLALYAGAFVGANLWLAHKV